MDVYFKIGEIAEAFGISVRALHLYDKMGLFTPEYTDEKTGYRYYTADQVGKLNTILSFKKIGFTLYEIKNILDNNLNKDDLLDMLYKKAKFFEDQIDIASFNIESINHIVKAIENSSHQINRNNLTEQEKAIKMSHIVCLENLKYENIFSDILWL